MIECVGGETFVGVVRGIDDATRCRAKVNSEITNRAFHHFNLLQNQQRRDSILQCVCIIVDNPDQASVHFSTIRQIHILGS